MLKLSKTGDYALKATCYIADRADILVQIKDISKELGISESILRVLIADLSRAAILTTVQGRYGGVKLARESETISVYDILVASGEELGITDCTKGEFCEKKNECYTTDVLVSLQRGMVSLLKMHTLDKIITR